jgi:hypothetical protein
MSHYLDIMGRKNHKSFACLGRLLGQSLCHDFMFMGRKGNIFLYKNINTRRYVNVDCDGNTYQHNPTTNGYDPIPRADAIKWVLS